MTRFQAPAGRTFFCAAPLPLEQMAHDLTQVAAYLQALAPAQALSRYDDWLRTTACISPAPRSHSPTSSR